MKPEAHATHRYPRGSWTRRYFLSHINRHGITILVRDGDGVEHRFVAYRTRTLRRLVGQIALVCTPVSVGGSTTPNHSVSKQRRVE